MRLVNFWLKSHANLFSSAFDVASEASSEAQNWGRFLFMIEDTAAIVSWSPAEIECTISLNTFLVLFSKQKGIFQSITNSTIIILIFTNYVLLCRNISIWQICSSILYQEKNNYNTHEKQTYFHTITQLYCRKASIYNKENVFSLDDL